MKLTHLSAGGGVRCIAIPARRELIHHFIARSNRAQRTSHLPLRSAIYA